MKQKSAYTKWFPIILYGIIMLLFHVCINDFRYDDAQYINMHLNESFQKWCDFLVARYTGWSSRLIIDGVMVLIVHHTWLWKILDLLLMVAIAVAFSNFFNRENKAELNWYIILALLGFPMRILNTAGWISTTLNYSWPFAFGLLAMWPIKRMICKERNYWYMYLLGVIGVLFATSQEQMCAVVFALSVVFTIYLWRRDKKLYVFALIEVLLSAISMSVILLCPGNYIRKADEIADWFPNFGELSLFRKLELGYSSSLYELIMEPNLVFTLFCGFLLVTVFIHNKNKVLRVIASIPFVVSMVFGMFGDWFESIFPNLLKLRDAMTEVGTGIILSSPKTWIPDILITVVVVCVLVSLWFAFEDKLTRLFSLLVLALGFATRWVMCFSPTIWASNDRTYTFLYMALIVVSILLIRRFGESKVKDSGTHKLLYCIVALLILGIADNYLYYFQL